jgi:hypothetical protein
VLLKIGSQLNLIPDEFWVMSLDLDFNCFPR